MEKELAKSQSREKTNKAGEVGKNRKTCKN